MRTVKVFTHEKRELKDAAHPFGKTYYEKVEKGTGLFHCWGNNFSEFETGPGNFTVAVVEMPDGTVLTPPAEDIQFLVANIPVTDAESSTPANTRAQSPRSV